MGEFQPTIRIYALAHQVLAVAKTRIEGAWSAYCDAVPGVNHEAEAAKVTRVGNKLPKEVAVILFPEFSEMPYAP